MHLFGWAAHLSLAVAVASVTPLEDSCGKGFVWLPILSMHVLDALGKSAPRGLRHGLGTRASSEYGVIAKRRLQSLHNLLKIRKSLLVSVKID